MNALMETLEYWSGAAACSLSSGFGRLVRPSPVMLAHETGNLGNNIFSKAGPIEHSIVTNTRLFIMCLGRRPKTRTKVVGGSCLAETGNIVLLAFDCHQGDTPYGARVDELIAISHHATR